jgi:hypothetical protein
LNARSWQASNSAHLTGLEETFQILERQRRRAIRAFWLTLCKAFLLLPFCLLPALLFLPSDDVIVLQTLTEQSASLLGWEAEGAANLALGLFIGGSIWFFGGLYLLLRYFNRSGREPGWAYLRDYKSTIFGRICASHFPGLAYRPDNGIPWRVLDDSNLFPWISDWYQSEDLFEGHVQQTDITFAEAHAKRERRRVAGDGVETYLDSYFRGIIFIADFHKHFHSTTRITPAGEKQKRVRRQKEVVLEDPEFQAQFATVSTDQTDVRYILSTSMMRRILSVHRRFPKLRILFQKDQMIMLLPTGKNRFEPSLHKPADCAGQINSFISDVEALLALVNELSLNLRIWSKS